MKTRLNAEGEIAMDVCLTGRGPRGLGALAGDADFERWIQPSAQELSADRQRLRSDVSISLTRLAKCGALVRGPDLGGPRNLHLRPDVVDHGAARIGRAATSAISERPRASAKPKNRS